MVEFVKEYVPVFLLLPFWVTTFEIFYHRATKSNAYVLAFSFILAACVIVVVGCFIRARLGVQGEVWRCILGWCVGSAVSYSLLLVFRPWRIREKFEKNK